ncbi:high-affinity nitrate transporter 3.1-like [Sesamum indicum]|uniref:High-affinity nitrate transporter n=1 Tax=Sesamum indicum TaxID=4182 RepID=A0A6I9TYS9_SESIN|nr:high-affinity nitrate transporter 3.1-like [Sesamum indicum]
MESYLLAVLSLATLSFADTCYGGVLFSTLPQTLAVSASPTDGQVLKAGEDNITVTWGLNQSFPDGTDSSYNEVKLMLCYGPISQADRGWRKTVDNLSKDKTCQFTIAHRTYMRETQNFTWMIERDVPTAVYFVRAYAYNSSRNEVAYGQTTDAKKSRNLFKVQAISGRHSSLDIASVCFSAFALLSVVGFMALEKRGRNSAEN